ncbi:hypothetical protein STEG23_018551, partial [Scotinomys teguina]
MERLHHTLYLQGSGINIDEAAGKIVKARETELVEKCLCTPKSHSRLGIWIMVETDWKEGHFLKTASGSDCKHRKTTQESLRYLTMSPQNRGSFSQSQEEKRLQRVDCGDK